MRGGQSHPTNEDELYYMPGGDQSEAMPQHDGGRFG
jgi:hypothetical protein